MFIVGNIVSCIMCGIVIAIALTAISAIIIAKINTSKTISPLGYIISLVMMALIAIQASLLIGAYKANGYIGDVSNYVLGSLYVEQDAIDSFSNAQVEQVKKSIAKEYPIFENYLNELDISQIKGRSVSALAYNIKKSITDEVDSYILFRYFWLIGILIIGILAIIMTCKDTRRGSNPTNKHNFRKSRHSTISRRR